MNRLDRLREFSAQNARSHSVMQFNPSVDTLGTMDLTANNTVLTREILADRDRFCALMRDLRGRHRASIGGYGENRTSLYSLSSHFTPTAAVDEPRTVHLGVDIWADAGEPVCAACDARVHSYGFNGQVGDYGATVILEHDLGDALKLCVLYGHLSRASLDLINDKPVVDGERRVRAGECVGWLGTWPENGGWPAHLHLQLIWADEMGDWKGDYPGVCKRSEQAQWLQRCPDPEILLQWRRYCVG